MNNKNPMIPDRLPEWVTANLDAILAFEPFTTPVRGCFVPGCRRDALRAGMCRGHFVRARDAYGPRPPSRGVRRESAGVAPAHDTEATTKNAQKGATK